MPMLDSMDLDRTDRARMAPLVAQRESGDRDPSKRDRRVDAESDMFLPVRTLRVQYLDYLDSKVDEIEEQKDSRRYYHGAQLTEEQRRVLKARHQPIQIWNRVGRKINGIVGVVERTRTDPKAEGRNPKSEAGAEIATQSVRYVLDSNMFKTSLEPIVLLQAGIEGISGTQVVLQQGDKGDPDIGLHWVIGDEYFYDPRSYQFNFKDVRYEGIAKWLDLDAAIEMFPDKREILEGLFQGDSDLTTNSDREIKWIISTSKRLRMVEHWYKWKGRWCWAFYAGHDEVLDQGVSPFFDERGNSESSFEMFSAAIDQDGDRYSFVRTFKGPQDALNQGKSKTLALANSRRITAEKGAVDDVEIARREAARHDGYNEVNPGKMFKIDDTHPDIATFSAFTDDAKAEMDGFANSNIGAMAGAGLSQISGRALELLRQPGMAELGPFVLARRAFKIGLYRKIWNAVQRHWKAERWIRVNSDEKLAQFIQLNGLDVDQWGRPTIVNAVGSLDVNIVLDEGPDIISMMQQTYETLKGYPPGAVPPQVLIELDPNLLRSKKDQILKMLAPQKPPPDPATEMMKKLQIEGMAGRNAKTAGEVQKLLASADQAAATAEEKRASVGHRSADLHLQATQFLMDTLFQAHQIGAPPQPQGGGGTPQGPQGQPQTPQGQQQIRAQPQARQRPPIPGARLAPDGKHYVPDPRRPGKYLMVA